MIKAEFIGTDTPYNITEFYSHTAGDTISTEPGSPDEVIAGLVESVQQDINFAKGISQEEVEQAIRDMVESLDPDDLYPEDDMDFEAEEDEPMVCAVLTYSEPLYQLSIYERGNLEEDCRCTGNWLVSQYPQLQGLIDWVSQPFMSLELKVGDQNTAKVIKVKMQSL